MKIESICVITDRYPTDEYPVNTFLDQLICQFAEQGIRCTVIAPYSPIRDTIKKYNYHPKKHWSKPAKNGMTIEIYCPKIFAVSGSNIAGINLSSLYDEKFYKAAIAVIEKEKITFDVLYAHFITPSGLIAARLSEIYKKPFFIAYGESSFDLISQRHLVGDVRKRLSTISGIISVSSKNKDELLANQVVNSEKIGVFPNSIDSSSFYKKSRKELRKKYNIDQKLFIVAFVGHFIERKGSRRLSEAIKKLDGVYSFFIGAGDQEPKCEGIIHKGRLPHKEVVDYLNMADIFVLPTLAEGCCNAIVEAMACGLPVVSSNFPFNDDILNDDCSIRIDPNDIDEIASAIEKLKTDADLRNSMSQAALQQAASLTLDKRAAAILDFMNEKLEEERA